MHQNRHTTHKIGMEILNLKVIDKHRLVKFLKLKTYYNRCRSVKVINLITLNKITCGNPTLSYYIERVVCCGVDITLIGIKVQYFINRVNVYLCDGFKLGFACFDIICPNLITDLDFVNAFLSVRNRYKRIAREIVLT